MTINALKAYKSVTTFTKLTPRALMCKVKAPVHEANAGGIFSVDLIAPTLIFFHCLCVYNACTPALCYLPHWHDSSAIIATSKKTKQKKSISI